LDAHVNADLDADRNAQRHAKCEPDRDIER
jgi:hypothetical protein